MPPRDRPPPHDAPPQSGAPPANFVIPADERVRAIAAGPPPYMRRLREIEDLVAAIARTLGERRRQALAIGADPEAFARSHVPRRAIARLEDLVERHNRFYPTEANLPMDPRTGVLRDRHGEPWRPLRCPSLDDLLRMSAAYGAAVRSVDTEGSREED